VGDVVGDAAMLGSLFNVKWGPRLRRLLVANGPRGAMTIKLMFNYLNYSFARVFSGFPSKPSTTKYGPLMVYETIIESFCSAFHSKNVNV
jgi:hypothetical protein